MHKLTREQVDSHWIVVVAYANRHGVSRVEFDAICMTLHKTTLEQALRAIDDFVRARAVSGS